MELKKGEIDNLTYELRRALEQKDAESAEVKQKVTRIEVELDKYEAKNTELVNALQAEKKSQAELKDQYDAIEKKLSRLSLGAVRNVEKSPEIKAFENFIRFGHSGAQDVLKNHEMKYLRTDSDIDGGYLAPNDYIEEILKGITEISPMRQAARVRTTTRESIAIPKRTNLVQGYWVGEGDNTLEGQSNYGIENIKVNLLAACTIATVQMLSDAAFNMESEINQDIIERFAQIEGTAFIHGNGNEKPAGILFNSEVQEIASGVANDITADSLIDMTGELKAGYNPVWMLNRRTLARIRRLKDGNGQYLWMPGLSDGQPSTILGEPYFSVIDMPDIAPGATPIVYGDFIRGYNIVDHTSMSLIRDPYVLASQHKIRFVAHRRTGGQVVMPEAIKKLKVTV